MDNFQVEEYIPSYKQEIHSLMVEFCDYLEKVDDLQRTTYKTHSPEYFINKMIEEAEKNHGKVFVAKSINKIIGFIGGYVGKQSIDEQNEAVSATPGIVNEFFVTSNARRSGIGSKLVKTLEDYLKHQGCDILRLEVFAPNKTAREFYARQGFVERSITIMKPLK